MALNLTQNCQAQVNGNVDKTTSRIRALPAIGLAENSQANVDRHVDQRTAITGGRRGLVALSLSKSGHTSINGNIDQAISDALLLAFNVSKDGTAETNRHANQVTSGLDSLHKDMIG